MSDDMKPEEGDPLGLLALFLSTIFAAIVLGGLGHLQFALPGPLLFAGVWLGTRSPESKSAMFGALGALMIWSAVSYAAWQFYLWNLGREMERAFNP